MLVVPCYIIDGKCECWGVINVKDWCLEIGWWKMAIDKLNKFLFCNQVFKCYNLQTQTKQVYCFKKKTIISLYILKHGKQKSFHKSPQKITQKSPCISSSKINFLKRKNNNLLGYIKAWKVTVVLSIATTNPH